PPFHEELLKRLGKRFGAMANWEYAPGKVPNQKIIAHGRDEAIKAALLFFSTGKSFDSHAGTIHVSKISTEDAEARSGDGLYRFIDIEFEDVNNQPVGRFVLRASANDPTFVTSYESPVRGDPLDRARFEAVGGVMMKFLEDEKMAYITDTTRVNDQNTLAEAPSLEAYRHYMLQNPVPRKPRRGGPNILVVTISSILAATALWSIPSPS